jgi:proteasome component ECM29
MSRQGPLSDALRKCLALADAAVAADLLPPLFGLLRRGVGLATRATAAAAVETLCEKCPLDVAVHSRKLLALLGEVAVGERSGVLRRAFGSALGAVARVASPQSVSQVLKGLSQRQRLSDGAPPPASHSI